MPLLSYLLFINALTLLLMLADKQKAKENLWRTPESFLLLLTAVGGSVGTLLGMRIARHKIRNPRFRFGVPAFFCIHALFAVGYYLLTHA